MNSLISDVRLRAIERFQEVAKKTTPGTDRFDDADVAISLALSPDRTEGPFLYFLRNLRRDARRIRQRRRKTFPFSSLKSAPVGHDPGANDTNSFEPPSRCPTPDEQLVASELVDQIRQAVRAVPSGELCFEAMLASEKPVETARRLNVPVYKVHYVRRRIKDEAIRLLGLGEVA